MRFRWNGVLRLLFALTILASFFLRPPGTMLALDGDTITYIICTGGEPETVTVALNGDGGNGGEIDLGCDFFTAQITSFPISAPNVLPEPAEAEILAPVQQIALDLSRKTWRPYIPRSPPHVS